MITKESMSINTALNTSVLQNYMHATRKATFVDPITRVSCQNGPTRHAYAWQIGPFWQDTLGKRQFSPTPTPYTHHSLPPPSSQQKHPKEVIEPFL